jgi:beta-glucanase (GH16 family)
MTKTSLTRLCGLVLLLFVVAVILTARIQLVVDRPRTTEALVPAPTPRVARGEASSISIPPGYDLVWHDEFDGPELDSSVWNYEVTSEDWGNRELQNYTDSPRNVATRDGHLVLTARREELHRKHYTSARINTSGRFSFKHGRVDIRAKLPRGKGMFPALWLYPQDNVYGGIWPLSGEIDIMEQLGDHPEQIFGTVHFGRPWPNVEHLTRYFTLPPGRTFADDPHVFTLLWEKDHLRWYVDDRLYSEVAPPSLSVESCADGTCPWVFNERFFLTLNLAVGGLLPGNPDASTVFPQSLEIDYVRVFQPSATIADSRH